jgi:hypothetical protein
MTSHIHGLVVPVATALSIITQFVLKFSTLDSVPLIIWIPPANDQRATQFRVGTTGETLCKSTYLVVVP